MNQVIPIFKREFLGYFRSPIGYVVLAFFYLFAAALTFFVMKLLRNNQASLAGFFQLLPWLYIFFVPAVGMRLWSEEKRSGTVELLFTLPVTTTAAVVGKFLAAWAFIVTGLLLTFPFAITVGYLGNPDWGVLISSYLAGILMAAAYLGISSLTSSLTRNQIISFVISAVICFLLVVLGWDPFGDAMNAFGFPVWLSDAITNFSFFTHFESITRGLVGVSSLIFFLSLTAFTLLLNVIVLER